MPDQDNYVQKTDETIVVHKDKDKMRSFDDFKSKNRERTFEETMELTKTLNFGEFVDSEESIFDEELRKAQNKKKSFLRRKNLPRHSEAYLREPIYKRPLSLLFLLAVVAGLSYGGWRAYRYFTAIPMDMTQALEVSFSGSNGAGVAEVKSNDIMYDNTNEKIAAFVESITYDFDPDTKLSNGDTVSVTVNYDEEMADKLNIQPKNLTKSFTVDDLVTNLDLTANLEVSFTGKTGFGFGSVKSNDIGLSSEDDTVQSFLGSIKYSFANDGSLKNDDTTTVTVSYDSALAEDLDLKLTNPTKTVTVSGLENVYYLASDMSDTDLQTLNDYADKQLAAFIEENSLSVTSEKYRNYFIAARSAEMIQAGKNNVANYIFTLKNTEDASDYSYLFITITGIHENMSADDLSAEFKQITKVNGHMYLGAELTDYIQTYKDAGYTTFTRF